MSEWKPIKNDIYEGFYRRNGNQLEIKSNRVIDKIMLEKLEKRLEAHYTFGININNLDMLLQCLLPDIYKGIVIDNNIHRFMFTTGYNIIDGFIMIIPLKD